MKLVSPLTSFIPDLLLVRSRFIFSATSCLATARARMSLVRPVTRFIPGVLFARDQFIFSASPLLLSAPSLALKASRPSSRKDHFLLDLQSGRFGSLFGVQTNHGLGKDTLNSVGGSAAVLKG